MDMCRVKPNLILAGYGVPVGETFYLPTRSKEEIPFQCLNEDETFQVFIEDEWLDADQNDFEFEYEYKSFDDFIS